MLVANFVRKKGRVKKCLCKWSGPFKAIKQLGPINYLIKDERRSTVKYGQIKNVSVRHLKPYYIHDDNSSFSSNAANNTDEKSEIESFFSLRGNDTNYYNAAEPPIEHAEQNIDFDKNVEFHDALNSENGLEVENDLGEPEQAEIETLRRSSRSRKPPTRFGEFFTH